MRWHLLKDKQKVIKIIEYLISREIEIRVRVEGERRKYESRFLDIVHAHHTGSGEEGPVLVMEKLHPERGNHRG